jgi:hypothetical protein
VDPAPIGKSILSEIDALGSSARRSDQCRHIVN